MSADPDHDADPQTDSDRDSDPIPGGGEDPGASTDGPADGFECESVVVDEQHAGQRVDHVLTDLVRESRSQVGRLIREGHVRIDGVGCTRPGRRVLMGEAIELDRPPPQVWAVEAEAIPLTVVYEDSELIVIDKAAGMVVHPAPGHRSGTLVHALMHHCTDLSGIGGSLRPGIVHRLDQGTTGILVVAKSDRAHQGLSVQFHDHTIDRRYLAISRGQPHALEGRVDAPIGRHRTDRKRMSTHSRQSREAATNWRMLERFGAGHHALLEIRPETGRTHQIRVHLASIGLPIAGDRVYGRARARPAPGLTALDRPALHAAHLGFEHPVSGARLAFDAPFPADLEAYLDALRVLEARGA